MVTSKAFQTVTSVCIHIISNIGFHVQLLREAFEKILIVWHFKCPVLFGFWQYRNLTIALFIWVLAISQFKYFLISC